MEYFTLSMQRLLLPFSATISALGSAFNFYTEWVFQSTAHLISLTERQSLPYFTDLIVIVETFQSHFIIPSFINTRARRNSVSLSEASKSLIVIILRAASWSTWLFCPIVHFAHADFPSISFWSTHLSSGPQLPRRQISNARQLNTGGIEHGSGLAQLGAFTLAMPRWYPLPSHRKLKEEVYRAYCAQAVTPVH